MRGQGIFLLFLGFKTLRVIVNLIFSNIIQLSFPVFLAIFIYIKGLSIYILSEYFSVSLQFNASVVVH